jgi:hypothetical protein
VRPAWWYSSFSIWIHAVMRDAFLTRCSSSVCNTLSRSTFFRRTPPSLLWNRLSLSSNRLFLWVNPLFLFWNHLFVDQCLLFSDSVVFCFHQFVVSCRLFVPSSY